MRDTAAVGVPFFWDTRLLADDFERGRPRFFQVLLLVTVGVGLQYGRRKIVTKTLPDQTSQDICEDIWSSELQIVNVDYVL